jgi:uncharacterized RDD family membrane protein YckC
MTESITAPTVPAPSEHGTGAAAAPLEYVGFRRRAAGRLIDFVAHYAIGGMAGVVTVILAYVVQGVTGRSAQPVMDRLQHGGPLSFLLAMIGAFLFGLVMEGFHGSTAGKLMVGITVLDETAQPCSVKAAAVRSLAYYFDGLFFGLVAESSMRTSPSLQRYGDRWAHTVVVRRRSAPPSSLHSATRFALVLAVACVADGAVLSAHAWVALFG